jgi:expansin
MWHRAGRSISAGVLAFGLLVACGGSDGSNATGTGGASSGGASSGGASSGGASSGGASSGGASSGGASSGGGGTGAVSACDGEPSHTGDGTYYQTNGVWNCGFDSSTGDLQFGAMNHTDYAASAACGACAHLTGPSGEVTVRIVDQCPECKPGDIDLSPQAFQLIADLALGRVTINWQYVPCDVTGPIVYRFKEGSNQWWTALQIRNHRNAIATLEYQGSGGNWVNVTRLDYNYFVEDAGMGPGPYSFRVTDVYGNQLVDTGIPHMEATEVPGAAQFPACATP